MNDMFTNQGKPVKLIGKKNVTIYQELFNYISECQKNGDLPFDGSYLGESELAQKIYKKKYYLKNLDSQPIENSPEAVFKRVAAFMATLEQTKPKQKKWAESFYNELFAGRFVPGGRVFAGAGDLYRLKTLANCFVSKIDNDDINFLKILVSIGASVFLLTLIL